MQGVSIIERAYQIAPESGSVDEVRRRLVREGYSSVDAHLSGPQIKRDLTVRLNPELRNSNTRR
jgi:hypothetical protein